MFAALIFVILVIAGLFFPKSKLLFVLQGLYLILVIGFRTGDPDHYIYQVEYSTAPFVYYKLADFPGWNLWMNFWIKKGIVFNQFLLIMAALCIILMLTGIYTIGNKLGGYIAFAVSMFLIYPFGHEATQMRTFMADAIVLVVLPLLLKDEIKLSRKIINYLIYFLAIIFATKIHTLAYYFLAIGIVYIILRSFKYELRTIIIGSITLIFLIHSGILNSFILEFLNTTKQDHWIANSNFSLGKLLPIILTIIIWIIVTNEIKIVSSNLSVEEQSYLVNVQKLMDTIFLLLPLLTYDITFNRLWRIYLILFYLVTGLFLYKTKGKNNYKKIIISVMFFCLIALIYIYENESVITSSVLKIL